MGNVEYVLIVNEGFCREFDLGLSFLIQSCKGLNLGKEKEVSVVDICMKVNFDLLILVKV